ncbi:hypothetical protein B1757_13355 [Acidithiobacillus marinus]|uniref:VWFA domain-containing protein n=1 Tax=Acidithiobacillus marinus TaxID=187490 RepID=A0A2I1DIK5_9PROT|nr:VWA domain-containing protein [Acidithiobacillus marinus]PKY09710.1 hypothetical protein B1757_13355 [Acidithiobacillus marinus]
MKMNKVLNAFSHGLACSGSRMQVKFKGNSVVTNGNEITLPNWLLHAGIEEVEMALGFSTNAMAHYLFSGNEPAQHALDDVGKTIWAVIDDSRVEREMMKDRPGTRTFLEPANQKMVCEAAIHKDANLHVLLVLAVTKGAIYPVLDDLMALVIKHHANQFGEQLCDSIQTVLDTTLSTTEKTEEIMRLIAENQEASQSSSGSGDSQPPQDDDQAESESGSESTQDDESPSSGESSESAGDGEAGEESEPSAGNEDASGDAAPDDDDQSESESGSESTQDDESPSSGESSESADDGESGEESEPSTGNEDALGDAAPEDDDQSESESGSESTQDDESPSSGESSESADDGESGEESEPSTGNEDALGDAAPEDESRDESESGSESTQDAESPSSGDSSESAGDGEAGEESEPSTGNEDAPGDATPEDEGQAESESGSESTQDAESPSSGESSESTGDGETGEESEPSTGNEDALGDATPEDEGQAESESGSESTQDAESPSSGEPSESTDDDAGEKSQPAYTLQSIAEHLSGIGSAEGACMENGQQVTVEILNPSNQRVSVDKGFYDLAASLAESVSRKSTPAKKGKGYALRTSCLPVVSSGINPFGQKRLVYGQSAHYVIAADMSGSMEDLYVRALNTTLSFAQLLQEQGDTMVDVITYYGNYEWAMNDQGKPVGVTPTGISIGTINRLDRIPDIKPDGLTPTAEAIVFAEDILKASPYERRGIIVITDGVPNEPHLDLCKKVERSGIEVYGLGLTEDGFEAVKANFTRAINAQNGHLAQALLAATA